MTFLACDLCANFVPWVSGGEPPRTFNPCVLKHKMAFQMPRSPIDDNWGHYRVACTDRVTGWTPWRPGASPHALLNEAGRRYGE